MMTHSNLTNGAPPKAHATGVQASARAQFMREIGHASDQGAATRRASVFQTAGYLQRPAPTGRRDWCVETCSLRSTDSACHRASLQGVVVFARRGVTRRRRDAKGHPGPRHHALEEMPRRTYPLVSH